MVDSNTNIIQRMKHRSVVSYVTKIFMWRDDYNRIKKKKKKDKAEQTLKEFADILTHNNNSKHIDWSKRIFLELNTKSLLAANIAHHHFECY